MIFEPLNCALSHLDMDDLIPEHNIRQRSMTDFLIKPVDMYMFEMPWASKLFCKELIEKAEAADLWGNYVSGPLTHDTLLKDLDSELNESYTKHLISIMSTVCIHFYDLDHDWKFTDILNYVVKYSQNDLELMEPHHDTTDLTFNMPLNDKQEFEGGGTYFVRQKYLHYGTVGNLTVHPSQITHKHGAKPVFKCARYALISLCSNEDKARNNSIKENNNENDF